MVSARDRTVLEETHPAEVQLRSTPRMGADAHDNQPVAILVPAEAG
jgi:hypothetical protein